MIRKVKYDYSFKLKSVEEVLKKHRSIEVVAKERGINSSQLRRWLDFYKSKGKAGLTPRLNRIYTLNFKLNVVNCISEKSLSLSSACKKFDIPSDSIIISWQKKYAQAGLLGLENKPRGRPPSMPFKRAKRKNNKPLTREEELMQENELLRAENALLKKLQALIQAEDAKEKERQKPSKN